MSKSMRFLGASIFLKGNWPSEGGFPVPSESRPEKGDCPKRGRPQLQARGPECASWICSLRPKGRDCGARARPLWSAPLFPRLPQQSAQLLTPASDSPATSRKAPPPGSSPSLGAGRGLPSGRPLSFPPTLSLNGSRRGPLYSDARQAWLPLI